MYVRMWLLNVDLGSSSHDVMIFLLAGRYVDTHVFFEIEIVIIDWAVLFLLFTFSNAKHVVASVLRSSFALHICTYRCRTSELIRRWALVRT